MIIGINVNKAKLMLVLLIVLMLFGPAMNCYAQEGINSVSGNDVIELDLGDYQSQMIVGSRQLLMVTVLPENATNKTLTYTSSNTQVATINGMGRITAIEKGETEITVTCGTVTGSFKLTVVEDASQVAVEDIEIQDYEEELEVDSALQLSATVLPANATNATVVYESSDSTIATVSSSGRVKGIAPGQVTIKISAGGVTKEITLTVKIATTSIQLNSDYQVLKVGDTFQIESTVQPQGADKNITYKSLDPSIATVSDKGMITAKACGGTAIIVSNDDLQVSVSVIVNEEGLVEENVSGERKNTDLTLTFPDKVSVGMCPLISSEMLKYFYEEEKVLTVKGENYTFFIDGKNIVNFENELDTELLFQQEENGFSFSLNRGNKLCGKIVIDLSDKIVNEKYLYLYNEAKGKYERISVEDISLLTCDTSGTYLLTSEKLSELELNQFLLIIGIVVVVLGVIVYIGVKKRYWFW